jgi:hypothetical protein
MPIRRWVQSNQPFLHELRLFGMDRLAIAPVRIGQNVDIRV